MGIFLFIFALILLLVAVATATVKVPEETKRDPYNRTVETIPAHRLPVIIPIGVGLLALLLILLSCVTTIQAKNVGVLTTFGRVSDRTLNAGAHLKLPWQKVTEIDGTVQTDRYHGSGSGDDKDNVTNSACIQVLLGDGGESCVSLANRWRVSADRANDVFANYRSDDPTTSLRQNVVSTELLSAVQDVVGKYNPLVNLRVVKGEDAANANLTFTPNYDQLSTDLTKEMQRRLGSDPLVDITKITVSFVPLPKDTQRKINQFTGEVANTRTAAQRVETANKAAAANRALRDSLQQSGPEILASKCLDTVAEAIDKKYQLNANFNCFGNSSPLALTTK